MKQETSKPKYSNNSKQVKENLKMLYKKIAIIVLIAIFLAGCYSCKNSSKNTGTIPLTKEIQETYKYEAEYGLKITKSENARIGQLVYWLAYPVSDEYQDIDSIKVNGSDYEIRSNVDSKYIVFYLNKDSFKNNITEIRLDITFKSYVFKYNYPKNFSSIKINKYDKTTDLYKEYTKGEQYINLNNNLLKDKSDEFYKESQNILEYAYKCYNWVASTFTYKNPLTGLYSVDEFIKNGGGDCGNFSSVFVTMMRIKGIPARHVIVRNTNNQLSSSFHMFAEICLEGYGWFPIDVTRHNLSNNDYFGKFYDGMLILHRGINFPLKSRISEMQINNATHLQLYYWQAYNTDTEKIKNDIIWETKSLGN